MWEIAALKSDYKIEKLIFDHNWFYVYFNFWELVEKKKKKKYKTTI